MVEWCTSEQIGRTFSVGPERLLAYATRGNLGSKRLPDGTMLYDAAQVARFFTPRGAILGLPAAESGAHLGRIGSVQLGVAMSAVDAADASAPDVGAPDVGAPDVGAPDTSAPDKRVTESGAAPLTADMPVLEDTSGHRRRPRSTRAQRVANHGADSGRPQRAGCNADPGEQAQDRLGEGTGSGAQRTA